MGDRGQAAAAAAAAAAGDDMADGAELPAGVVAAGVASRLFVKQEIDKMRYKTVIPWSSPPILTPKGYALSRGYSPRYKTASLDVCGVQTSCTGNLYEAWWRNSAVKLGAFPPAERMALQMFCWRGATNKYLSLGKATKAGHARDSAVYECFKSLVAIRRSDLLHKTARRAKMNRGRIRRSYAPRRRMSRRGGYGGGYRRSYRRRY